MAKDGGGYQIEQISFPRHVEDLMNPIRSLASLGIGQCCVVIGRG